MIITGIIIIQNISLFVTGQIPRLILSNHLVLTIFGRCKKYTTDSVVYLIQRLTLTEVCIILHITRKPNLKLFYFIVHSNYRKIPKISSGTYIFERLFLRGLYWRGYSMEATLRFKIAWASLVFALFCFVFEGSFQVQAPGGLIFGGTI